MDVEGYLRRIGYEGERGVSARVLGELHVAHLGAVPFENLSIHRGERIVLEEGLLLEKVVARRRGGFCYELNGVFGALLRAMGFEVQMLAAEVMGKDGQWGPPFDHMTLLVSLEELWLADVGFGDCFREPLRLAVGQVQEDGGRAYRLEMDGDKVVLWQRGWEGDWQPQYRFDLTPYAFEDFVEMCDYQQDSPESGFRQRRVCTRLLADGGRVTLAEGRLIRTGPDGTKEERVVEEREREGVLREWFGIWVGD